MADGNGLNLEGVRDALLEDDQFREAIRMLVEEHHHSTGQHL